ncbi:EF-hand domain-containing protein [Sphingomonas sp.]|uniref:EF-hand domain-containing protein n=1 Tax=Sphingomonas sp. TaxID=28214 RepID=UPI003B3B2911
MIKTMLAVGLVAIATAAAAQTPPAAPPEVITRADFQAQSRAQVAAADTNHDGIVTKAELEAVITKAMGGPPPAGMVDGVFGALDTNHDGKATAAEIEAHDLALFDRWDTNHDGKLTREEMMAGSQAAGGGAPKQ